MYVTPVMTRTPDRPYTEREEISHWLTHGIAFVASIFGTLVLLYTAITYGTVWHAVGFGIFGCSLILLYLSSTLYHLAKNPALKQKARIFDHAAIFILIAGTYTPFLIVYLRESVGWPFLGIIWSLALAGITFKVIFKTKFRVVSLILYLAMGWLCVLAARQMLESIPANVLLLMVLGGLSYTLGVLFYTWRSLPYHHAIWHLFVIGGSVFHYFAILRSASAIP